jgi:hypothetical protein
MVSASEPGRAWRALGIPKRELVNRKKQPLMNHRFFKNQEKPGGTGVPPVQAQVENLCHQIDEH